MCVQEVTIFFTIISYVYRHCTKFINVQLSCMQHTYKPSDACYLAMPLHSVYKGYH